MTDGKADLIIIVKYLPLSSFQNMYDIDMAQSIHALDFPYYLFSHHMTKIELKENYGNNMISMAWISGLEKHSPSFSANDFF